MTINWLTLMLYIFMGGHLVLAISLLGSFLSQTFSSRTYNTMSAVCHKQTAESRKIIYSRTIAPPLYKQTRSAHFMH